MAEEIISWKAASAAGMKLYYTGKPCKRGHLVERHVSDRKCLICKKENRDEFEARNPGYQANYQASYRVANRARLSGMRAKPSPQSREKINRYQREYRARRCKSDPEFLCLLLMHDIFKRATKAVKGGDGTSKFSVLGYGPEDLRLHMEKQFSRGMSWDNHGEWHIDHIIPVAEMIKAGIKDPAKIHCLSNLRPLWATDNLKKGDRVVSLL